MNEKIIVTLPSRNIRAIARDSLHGNWKAMALAFAIFNLLTTFVSNILDIPFSYHYTSDVVAGMFESSGLPFNSDVFHNAAEIAIPYGSSIYGLFVIPCFELGITMLFLNFFRRHTVEKGMIFDGFSHWFKAFILTLLMGIKIVLWTFLFVVPGIIAAINYSQAFNLLADHPDWSASQCIRESINLMRGNRIKYVCLLLSFIGWSILSQLPLSIFSEVGDVNPYIACIADFFLSIPVFFYIVYLRTSQVALYEMMNGNLHIISPEMQDQYTNVINADYKVEEHDDKGSYYENKNDNDNNYTQL